jgi:hypothetical protein
MHLLTLLVALWLQLSPAPARDAAHRGPIYRTSTSPPVVHVAPTGLSGDASSGSDPWGS